jgi:DNA gyrase/topoisomerase IV subunit A
MNETSENLINGNITEIMQSAYIDYSMSVLVRHVKRRTFTQQSL